MGEYLVRKFIKDYEQVTDPKVRADYGVLVSVVGIGCNGLLFLAKLLVGILSGSISVMADACNNLSDAASSVIGFIGVKMAQKPADEDHPFGHGRMEYISALVVALIVIQVGVSLFQTSVGKIRYPEDMTFRVGTIWILLMSIGVKWWLGSFNRKMGNRIQSAVMKATATDCLGDVAVTGATILSMLIFGGFGWNVDGYVGLAVAVVVVLAGVNIARDTLSPLLGEAIDPAVYRQINQFVLQYDGIVGTHDLIVHSYGPSRRMASIHAEVPKDSDMEQCHQIVDTIERDCMRQLGIFLVVHMDPVELHDEQTAAMKAAVAGILEGLDSRLDFHDFRMVCGNEKKNLIFDLVVPREYHAALQDIIKKKISEEVQKQCPDCSCIITVENSFCQEALKS